MGDGQGNAGKGSPDKRQVKGTAVKGDHQVIRGHGDFKILKISAVDKGPGGLTVLKADQRDFVNPAKTAGSLNIQKNGFGFKDGIETP